MSKKFFILLLLTALPVIGYKVHFNNKRLQKAEIKQAVEATYKNTNSEKFKVAFDREGINEIALLTMIKDEEDIIFENLVWHFSIGFRKFVIVDNLSTDRTSELVNNFIKLTGDQAAVFVIRDPVVAHIQSRIITGGYHFIRSVWPEVKWVFPVDGDEFWTPKVKLRDILQKLPSDIGVLSVGQIIYQAADDFDKFPAEAKFYEKIHYRTTKYYTANFPKVAVRVKPNVIIAQGNHSAVVENYASVLRYGAANNLGLDMVTYPHRSPLQTMHKYNNGMKANLLGKKQGLLGSDIGTHWDSFEAEIAAKGSAEIAARDRFKASYINMKEALDDPFPMGEAIKLFEEIVKKAEQN
jgi:hypothetical protein